MLCFCFVTQQLQIEHVSSSGCGVPEQLRMQCTPHTRVWFGYARQYLATYADVAWGTHCAYAVMQDLHV